MSAFDRLKAQSGAVFGGEAAPDDETTVGPVNPPVSVAPDQVSAFKPGDLVITDKTLTWDWQPSQRFEQVIGRIENSLNAKYPVIHALYAKRRGADGQQPDTGFVSHQVASVDIVPVDPAHLRKITADELASILAAGKQPGQPQAPHLPSAKLGVFDPGESPAVTNKPPLSAGAAALQALMRGETPEDPADANEGREWGAIGAVPPKASPAPKEPPLKFKNSLLEEMYRLTEGGRTFWHFDSNERKVAFTECDQELTFLAEDQKGVVLDAIRLGLLLAVERGWTPPHLDGTESFRRKAFLEAARLKIVVTGYAPTEQDLKLLKREGIKPTIPADNPITGVKDAPAHAGTKSTMMEC